MAVEVATYVSDLSLSDPPGTDLRKQGDDHLRLIKAVLQASFPNATKPFYIPGYIAKTTTYAALASDQNKIIGGATAGGGWTLTLPTLAVSLAGWAITVIKTDASPNLLTIVPAIGTINGAASLILDAAYEFVEIMWNGTAWLAKIIPAAVVIPVAATVTEQLTGTSNTVFSTPLSGASHWKKGSNIASAATITIGDGGLHHVTGTAEINDIDFVVAVDGRPSVLIFDGILLLTNSATLPLTGAANITTKAGDLMFVWQDSGDTVKTHFVRADGTAIVSPGIALATEQATTSGTSKDFTGIPAGTKRITVMLTGVSTNGTSNLLIQIGDAGGFEITGYTSSSANPGVILGASTIGFIVTAQIAAAFATRGTYVFSIEDPTSFTWVGTGITIANSIDQMCLAAGSKSLSAELTQIRLTTVNGTDTFDAGSVNISYEQ
jgi:hypothetical protein